MNTPSMIAVILIGLFLIVAAICRLNMLNVRRHYYRWIAVYLLMSIFAAGSLADCLTTGELPTPWTLAGLLAAAMNILTTRDRWIDGAPWQAEKPGYRNDRRSFAKGR